ncbi:MAG: hypothetical protein IPG64_26805 [Haliea sp.]|nr:hypothetical protein [Haliea sp.]MBK6741209.1 hypothetical protein [Haliea sp.]
MPAQLFKICSLPRFVANKAALFALTCSADAALGHLPGACVHSSALNVQPVFCVQRAGDPLSPEDWHLWLGSSKGESRHPVETSTNGHKIKDYQLLGET